MSMLLKIARFYGRFLLSFTAIGYRWRSMFWQPLTADLQGQTWLVTGASGGLGRAIALGAARRGARVLAAARSAAKLDEVVQAARNSRGGEVVPMVVDFSLKADVRAFADRLVESGQPLDVLVNNVGVLLDDFTVTTEGHETSFATNLLSHFILTERLLQAQMLRPGGAVINMSSGGMYNAPLVIGALDAKRAQDYNGVRAYALHKRGQAALTRHWSDQWSAAQSLAFYVMHPGWVDTEGVKTSLPRFRRILQSILRDADQGADTALWLGITRPQGTDPEAFWFDRAPRPAHVYAYTRESRHQPSDLVEHLRSLSAR